MASKETITTATTITKKPRKQRAKKKYAISHLKTKMKDMDNIISKVKEETGINIIELFESQVRKIDHTDIDAKEWISEHPFPNGYEHIKEMHPYCWAYKNGEKRKKGYYSFGQSGTGMHVHRLAYIILKNQGNKIDDKLEVAHLCNNKWCVNPNHLILVTKRENQNHKIVHKSCVNLNKSNQKIQSEDATRIRELYATGFYTHQEIANRYNISRKLVTNICLGILWKHASGPITSSGRKKVNYKYSAKKIKQIRKIRKLYEKGISQKELANLFNLCPTSISNIVNKEWFKEID